MMLGRFVELSDGSFIGHIRTMFFKSDKVVFEPIPGAGTSEKSPAYRIFTSDEIELGAAWRKVGKDGTVYYEVTLDDPTLAAPIFPRLFQAKGKSGFILLWERKKSKKAA